MAGPRVLLVTGLAGAGRSTCLKVLEDNGFEAVDNLPLDLAARLLASEQPVDSDLAIGVDSRTRAFSPEGLLELRSRIRERGGDVSLLYLDCDDDVLQRRFTETRRRHPLAQDRSVSDGIARERLLLGPVRAAADIVLDTTLLSVVDFRRMLTARFARGEAERMAVTVVSFAYRNGLPREADLVFDVRFLDNPHYIDALRPLTGRDAPVQAHIRTDPGYAGFVGSLENLLLPLLPRYNAEGKSYLTIGIGCTGGKHRSVFVAEEIAGRLRHRGWRVGVVHRELAAAGAAGDRT
ncbi:MAG: RNase adapter RapZ [Geminicoccaceae bacterium]